MGRPRGFVEEQVLDTVMDLFWERGYQATGLADLEEATHLKRSSLYRAFGSKEDLFSKALDRYIGRVTLDVLGIMEGPESNVDDAERFFRRLAARFRDDEPLARRGCLWVNSIVESAGDGTPPDARGTEYMARVRAAFSNSLSRPGRRRRITRRSVERRAVLLTAALFGIWVRVRVDPEKASLACEEIAAEVRTWTRTSTA